MYISMLLAAQAQFTGCFADNCTTLVVGGPSSNAEDCCVNNNAGLYYNQGGQCFQCIGKRIFMPRCEVYSSVCVCVCLCRLLQLLKDQ